MKDQYQLSEKLFITDGPKNTYISVGEKNFKTDKKYSDRIRQVINCIKHNNIPSDTAIFNYLLEIEAIILYDYEKEFDLKLSNSFNENKINIGIEEDTLFKQFQGISQHNKKIKYENKINELNIICLKENKGIIIYGRGFTLAKYINCPKCNLNYIKAINDLIETMINSYVGITEPIYVSLDNYKHKPVELSYSRDDHFLLEDYFSSIKYNNKLLYPLIIGEYYNELRDHTIGIGLTTRQVEDNILNNLASDNKYQNILSLKEDYISSKEQQMIDEILNYYDSKTVYELISTRGQGREV